MHVSLRTTEYQFVENETSKQSVLGKYNFLHFDSMVPFMFDIYLLTNKKLVTMYGMARDG